MYKCECGREFTTPQGRGYHKRFCGKNKISLDQGYEIFIDNTKNGKLTYVHRYVMEQKLGRELRSDELVHHIDGNRRNNDPENLELSTRSEHAKHHYETLSPEEKIEKADQMREIRKLVRHVCGSKHPNAQLNEDQVREIKTKLQNGQTRESIGKEYNVSGSLIQDIHLGRSWKHVKI